jgi:hypothetical protein
MEATQLQFTIEDDLAAPDVGNVIALFELDDAPAPVSLEDDTCENLYLRPC